MPWKLALDRRGYLGGGNKDRPPDPDVTTRDALLQPRVPTSRDSTDERTEPRDVAQAVVMTSAGSLRMGAVARRRVPQVGNRPG